MIYNRIGFTLIELVIGLSISCLLIYFLIFASFKSTKLLDQIDSRRVEAESQFNALKKIAKEIQNGESITVGSNKLEIKLSEIFINSCTTCKDKTTQITYELEDNIITRNDRELTSGILEFKVESIGNLTYIAITSKSEVGKEEKFELMTKPLNQDFRGGYESIW